MLFVQADRQVQFHTSLGEDVLYLDKLFGREEVSRLYRFDVGLYSEDREIVFDDIVGRPVGVSVARPGAGPRFLHGFVNSFEHVLDLEDFAYYRATVVPWLWFLTRTSNCRIFQGMTAPDIVRDVIRAHGFTDFEFHLTEEYPALEYCTQYRETDFNFVSRLLEEFGLHYVFRHEAERHVLLIADSLSAHSTVNGLEEIRFDPDTRHNRTDNTIWEWTVGRRVQPFRYEIRDFDCSAPNAPVVSTGAGEPRMHEHSGYEIYDYAGLRMKPDHSNLIATRRIEELESKYERTHGRMGTAGLGIGSLFDLTEAPRGDQNREYFVTGGEHEIRTNRFRSGGEDGSEEETYEYRFSCQAADHPFRPARITPRPVIQGPQTAIVTGPDGEEIHVDDRARVKVRFHWDRSDTPNQDASIWIRVAQMWAGNIWGALFMPRIGHEVVVEFLEGDPDRPLITGSVYNESQQPPFLRSLEKKPQNKTVSTILTSTSKGGEGYNGIAFQDKEGEEGL
ncbi:MAG: type VI secretion system tip protein TssI/VgrG, partial [Planctomycetota bacterium]